MAYQSGLKELPFIGTYLHYYNSKLAFAQLLIIFFRVIKDFMIQGGDFVNVSDQSNRLFANQSFILIKILI